METNCVTHPKSAGNAQGAHGVKYKETHEGMQEGSLCVTHETKHGRNHSKRSRNAGGMQRERIKKPTWKRSFGVLNRHQLTSAGQRMLFELPRSNQKCE